MLPLTAVVWLWKAQEGHWETRGALVWLQKWGDPEHRVGEKGRNGFGRLQKAGGSGSNDMDQLLSPMETIPVPSLLGHVPTEGVWRDLLGAIGPGRPIVGREAFWQSGPG